MIYAIGDIHGNIDILEIMYNRILQHIKERNDHMGAKIVFLGDYIDRGETGFEVLKFLMNLKDSEGLEHIFLYGNHEQMFLEAEFNINVRDMWFKNGGESILKELNINPILNGFGPLYNSEVFMVAKEWIVNKCVLLYNDVDYTFVHGCFNKNLPIESQREEQVIWGRLDPGYYDNHHKMIVHGHTPSRSNKPIKGINVINLDIGAGYKKRLASAALPHIREDSLIEFMVYDKYAKWSIYRNDK